MPSSRGRLGTRGERAAERYLASLGYEIVERNYRCPWGEVDLVTRDGPSLVFVEVRTRRSHTFGSAEESVTRAKAKRIMATAATYLQEHGMDGEPWRIDLVAVDMDGSQQRLRHIPNAVMGP
ncbi:MAG: YraN family protein [Chloroflexi bacterium]|nr:YraN family protein [Chloroflexota bacterium]